MAPGEQTASGPFRVGYEGGSWVTTDDGPVRLEQGEALPENVHPDEVARLANAGVLEGYDQELELVGLGGERDEIPTELPDGNVDELKVRIGSDPELARAYLERENAREKPRTTFVAHLEQVIAADEERTEPATPPASVVDESDEA